MVDGGWWNMEYGPLNIKDLEMLKLNIRYMETLKALDRVANPKTAENRVRVRGSI
jgi:hypothetical protein